MSTETQAAIAAANQRFMEMFDQGDAAGMGNSYTPDGQILPPNLGPITGQGPIAEFWGGVMGMGIKTVRLTTVEVEDHGATAVEIGNYSLGGGDGQTLDQGKYLVVWKDVGNGWKLHRDIWNSSMPPA